MVDLKAKPFYLNSAEIQWVENAIASMSPDEKLSQLFVLLKPVPGADEEQIKRLMETTKPGGMRWQGGDMQTVARQNAFFQKYSRIPVLIAGNCDDGGNGALPKEGTFVATAAEAGASEGTETAYRIGYVAGKEASAIGVNWMFNPVADVYKNWRNTIVNTRSFGHGACVRRAATAELGSSRASRASLCSLREGAEKEGAVICQHWTISREAKTSVCAWTPTAVPWTP